jgi:hypothetical protein
VGYLVNAKGFIAATPVHLSFTLTRSFTTWP